MNIGDIRRRGPMTQRGRDDGRSALCGEFRSFLVDPPLDPVQRIGYQALYRGALATIPDRVRTILDVQPTPLDHGVGRSFVRFLRWALGSSPSWQLSLVRMGADIPDGLFRQPLPDSDVTTVGTQIRRARSEARSSASA